MSRVGRLCSAGRNGRPGRNRAVELADASQHPEESMKTLLAGLALVASLGFAVSASAQMAPGYPGYSQWVDEPTMMPAMPMYRAPVTPEMIDNGSSSDYPTHTPSDFTADQLN